MFRNRKRRPLHFAQLRAASCERDAPGIHTWPQLSQRRTLVNGRSDDCPISLMAVAPHLRHGVLQQDIDIEQVTRCVP
jgi:hypothetical protein